MVRHVYIYENPHPVLRIDVASRLEGRLFGYDLYVDNEEWLAVDEETLIRWDKTISEFFKVQNEMLDALEFAELLGETNETY